MASDSSSLVSGCAIAALEEKNSPGCQHGRTGSFPAPRHSKSIYDCPAEVLVMFFKFLYFEEKFKLGDQLEWRDSDVKPPSLFPHAIAAVCSFWRDIMSSVPEFWTRIMISLDSPTIPQSVITSQLLLSRDLPLDVIVTLDHVVDGQHERKQVMSLMETIINPHIDRLRKLRINVRSSSSLPSFPDDFHGTATKLKYLQLQCSEDDGGSTYSYNRHQIVPSTEPQYPVLSTLELDGRNYYKGCRRAVPWAMKAPNVGVLSISHYKPRTGEPFPAHAFMLFVFQMKKLEIFRINNVALRAIDHRPVVPVSMKLTSFELCDIPDFPPIDDMFHVFQSAVEVKFTRCAVGPTRAFGEQGPLELTEIAADQDLVPLLRSWRGCTLNIRNCPCFNDAVLNMMGTKDENGRYACAPRAYELLISDCPNFSVDALKRLVAARLDNNALPYTSQFDIVSVRGDVPMLSAEDRSWFDERVPEFDYP